MNFPSVQALEVFLILMLTTAYHMNLRFLTTEVRGGKEKDWKSCLKTGNIIPSWKEKKPYKNKMRILAGRERCKKNQQN